MALVNRRISLAVGVVAAVAVLLTGCTRNTEAWDSAVLVNRTRHSAGLSDVTLEGSLVEKAQAWAEQMAASGNVRHSNLSEGVRGNWRVLGENVGWARSIDEMHDMFMRSPAHRQTILDRRFSRFGVGVAVSNGRYYTVQVYAG